MPRRRQRPAAAPERIIPVTKPSYDPLLAEQIKQYLTIAYEPRRPPEVASRILAFVIALNAHPPRPFPRREEVAQLLHCSKDGLDTAISVALARKLLKIKVETVKSFGIKSDQREGVIRHRYYMPTEKLLMGAGSVRRAA